MEKSCSPWVICESTIRNLRKIINRLPFFLLLFPNRLSAKPDLSPDFRLRPQPCRHPWALLRVRGYPPLITRTPQCSRHVIYVNISLHVFNVTTPTDLSYLKQFFKVKSVPTKNWSSVENFRTAVGRVHYTIPSRELILIYCVETRIIKKFYWFNIKFGYTSCIIRWNQSRRAATFTTAHVNTWKGRTRRQFYWWHILEVRTLIHFERIR